MAKMNHQKATAQSRVRKHGGERSGLDVSDNMPLSAKAKAAAKATDRVYTAKRAAVAKASRPPQPVPLAKKTGLSAKEHQSARGSTVAAECRSVLADGLTPLQKPRRWLRSAAMPAAARLRNLPSVEVSAQVGPKNRLDIAWTSRANVTRWSLKVIYRQPKNKSPRAPLRWLADESCRLTLDPGDFATRWDRLILVGYSGTTPIVCSRFGGVQPVASKPAQARKAR
jgi:hypothetical protein